MVQTLPIMLSDAILQSWNPCAPDEARALVRAVVERARQEGVDLSPAPTKPDNCCGNGCIGCVWEGFYSDLAYWRDESLLRWAA